MGKPPFECSSELRTLFTRHFEHWKKKHQAGMEELAERCGVSPSYLSHVGRYGRIPGKPILILLALNFDQADPRAFFDAARLHDEWPYESGSAISVARQDEGGFLSVKLDMHGFTEAIRSIMHSEDRPRDVQDLTRGKPLRLGLSPYQDVMMNDPELAERKGFFPEFCNMLAMTLRCRIETVEVPYAEYPDKLRNNEIDCFGPKIVRPGSNPGFMTAPFCRVGISALVRKRPAPLLEKLPPPKTHADLLTHRYTIAVLRNSRSHLYANVALRRADSELILCDSMEEAVERTMLAGISRPVHLTICNSPNAISVKQSHPRDLDLVFASAGSLLEFSDNCIAVRSDWPELVAIMNQSIAYLLRTGALAEHFERCIPGQFREVIQLPEFA